MWPSSTILYTSHRDRAVSFSPTSLGPCRVPVTTRPGEHGQDSLPLSQGSSWSQEKTGFEGKKTVLPVTFPGGSHQGTRALSFTPHTHEGSVPRPTLRSLDELSQNESAFIRVLGPQSVPKWEQDLCGLLSKVATCQHHCLKFKVQPIVI